MEDRIYIAALLDTYGELLKPRQKDIMNMCFSLDYSLSEIGEELNVSRQGVHDTVKKSVKILKFYEEKLSLVRKKITRDKILFDIREDIKSLNIYDEDKNRLLVKLNELEETF